MPEIMSAEELADYINRHGLDICHGEIEGINEGNVSGFIRSRDAAIIEKCKEAIKAKYQPTCWQFYNPFVNSVIDMALSALDSVLSDINGGK